MRKTLRRILASVLTAVMLLTAAPIAGFDFKQKASALDSSGSCGTNVTYTFDSKTGLLTIGGTGAMRDYDYSSSPFYEESSIKSVVINSGVTSIGDFAFVDCTGLTSATIGNSVENIGYDAFYGCTGLTSITVDSNNPVYDSRNNCKAIIETQTNTLIQGCRNTIIPDSVASIGDYAFAFCYGLTSITIPDSVTNIGVDAFFGCSSLTSVIIGNSVTSIGDFAFVDCTGLTSVTIPDSVTSIGDCAFEYCTGLTSVTIPDSVTNIGDGVFSGCTGLTSIKIPDSVESIDYKAFYNCAGLTSITIPKSVMYIGTCAFGYEQDDFGNSQKFPNFKIYCYSGTAGEQYAIENEFDYELIDDSKPSTVTDKNSGILLEFPAWAYNGDVTLKVKEVLSGSSFDIAEKISGKTHLKVFSIETYVNSKSVQPNGEVTVKIPVPDGFNAEKCKLYYLNASSKNPEEIAITIKDGYIVFKTNHFSDWAIVQFADLGDVNEDSRINSSDALLVLRHSTGLITLSDSKKLNADVTRDGKINSTDALKILQYSTGIITSF